MKLPLLACALAAACSSPASRVEGFRAFDHLRDARSADWSRRDAGRAPDCAIAVSAQPATPGDFAGPWVVDTAIEGEATTSVYGSDGRLVAISDAKKFVIDRVAPWTTEAPTNYLAVVSDGQAFYARPLPFRVTEVRDGRLFLNGAAIGLKAVDGATSAEAVRAVRGNAVAAEKASDADAPWLYDRAGVLMLSGDEPGVRRGRCAAAPDSGADGPVDLCTAHRFRDWRAMPTNEFRKVRLENRCAFVGSADVTCRWTALRDGAPFASGLFDISDLGPGAAKAVAFPPVARRIHRERGGLVSLRVRFCRGAAEDAPELGHDQFDLPFSPESLPAAEEAAVVSETPDARTHLISAPNGIFGGGWRITVAKADGAPTAIARTGWFWDTEILGAPLRLNGTGAVARWRVRADGTVALRAVAGDQPPGGEGGAVRFALAFAVRGDDEKVLWFGRGPGPTLPEAKEHASVGEYAAAADELSGVREDVFGVRIGRLSVRTLGEPFAFRVASDGASDLVRVEILAAPGRELLDLTLSLDDASLLPRLPGEGERWPAEADGAAAIR